MGPRDDKLAAFKEPEYGGTVNVGHSPEGEPDTGKLIENQIHCDGHFAAQSISCSYHEGVLILRGRVPTYHLKQIAQTVAMQMDGVEQVDNRIEVRNSRAVPLRNNRLWSQSE